MSTSNTPNLAKPQSSVPQPESGLATANFSTICGPDKPLKSINIYKTPKPKPHRMLEIDWEKVKTLESLIEILKGLDLRADPSICNPAIIPFLKTDKP